VVFFGYGCHYGYQPQREHWQPWCEPQQQQQGERLFCALPQGLKVRDVFFN
jgi:hypothetical protein